MKIRNLFFATLLAGMISCQTSPYKGVDTQLVPLVEQTIEAAGTNGAQLRTALDSINPEYRNGMAFLIAYMPKGDRDTLSADFLVKQVELAYKARETFAWTKALPDSIFLNDVLPYASLDETRENWREPFFEMLYPLVKDSKDMYAAIDTVNKALRELVKVEYNTKRNKPNQSPFESMSINMASCSGLSILLTDAFRAVGIPSRIAGTPLWVSKEGNHNWSEVWLDGQWYFTEYYPDALNKSWFLERAAKADKSDPIYWIYASSYKPTGVHFPMVWDMDNKDVPAYDVTDEYIRIYAEQQAAQQNGVAVVIRMYKNDQCSLDSEGRLAENIVIKNSAGEIVVQGTTAGPTADMNDYLTVRLPENETFTLVYPTAKGTKTMTLKTDKAQDIRLAFE